MTTTTEKGTLIQVRIQDHTNTALEVYQGRLLNEDGVRISKAEVMNRALIQFLALQAGANNISKPDKSEEE